jgi:putative flippase GtrA
MVTQSRSSKAIEQLRRHEIVRQFAKYALVGCLNVAIFLGIFNALRLLTVPIFAADAIAFAISSVNSFVLNKLWSFQDHRREVAVRQYFVFVFFTLVGLGLQLGIFRLLLVPLERYGRLGENGAALGALPFSVIWNFTTYKLWTFKPSPRATSA